VPIHGSPHQGRPALLRDEHTSRGCSLALSGNAGVIGIFERPVLVSELIGYADHMQALLTY
jgi:hypothetical protein